MNNKGFTIIELLMIISIMTILMIVALISYQGITDKVQTSVYSGLISDIYIAGEKYTAATGENIVYVKDLVMAGYLEDSSLKDNKGNDISCYYIDTNSKIDDSNNNISKGRVWQKSSEKECNANLVYK